MSYLYRCTKSYKSGKFKGQRCRQRHHFKHKVEWYIRTKVCKDCKNEITHLDKWQMKKNKEKTCNCGDPMFPHQEASSVWCRYHKTGPSEEDFKCRYGG